MASPASFSLGLRISPRRARPRRGSAVTIAAVTVLLLIVLLCAIGPLLAKDPSVIDNANRFAGPSSANWFGTDELGRDLFARIVEGGRISLGIAAGATVVSMALGLLWGFAAALGRGLPDELLMRLADVTMAIPQLLFALVFVAAFGASTTGLALIVGVLLTPVTARMIRSAVLGELQSDYTEAARAYGASRWRLMAKEVLPNIGAPLGVQAAINAANAIVLEAALSFVGLGVQPPDASWGTLLQQGYQKMYSSTTGVIFPALAIFLTIWMLNLLADQLGGTDDLRGRTG
jgi:ABC-type dipeptide/oligopeptide/nickel transport system permease subunit